MFGNAKKRKDQKGARPGLQEAGSCARAAGDMGNGQTQQYWAPDAPLNVPNLSASPYIASQHHQQTLHPWASTTNLAQRRPQNAPRRATAALGQAVNLSQANLALHSQQFQRHHDPTQPLGVDDMQDRMSMIITSIDDDESPIVAPQNAFVGGLLESGVSRALQKTTAGQNDAPRNVLAAAYFSKVWAYSNSRLPPHLPPFRVYLPTYPLLCLAAQYSLSSYSTTNFAPTAAGPCTTATVQIPSSLRLGTKAMVLALAPCTSSSTPTLIIAIRGSATFADWAINYSTLPTSPAGFLDDDGNLVHSGFLHVARSSVGPMAQQLAHFLASQIDAGKWRDQGQLLLTGHSAGGAVATLLFCHLLSQSPAVDSSLKQFRGAFKRIHCITFGVPPVSLLPLGRPQLDGVVDRQAERRWKKNLFFAFMNEGDPVVRADKAYVRSLLDLYTSSVADTAAPRPVWPVPTNTLSNAGRLVVLRPVAAAVPKRRGLLGLGKVDDKPSEQIEASMTSDEQLRTVVFGDPMMHSMRLYKDRIDKLATTAVTVG